VKTYSRIPKYFNSLLSKLAPTRRGDLRVFGEIGQVWLLPPYQASGTERLLSNFARGEYRHLEPMRRPPP
jgi:hypothetical protein